MKKSIALMLILCALQSGAYRDAKAADEYGAADERAVFSAFTYAEASAVTIDITPLYEANPSIETDEEPLVSAVLPEGEFVTVERDFSREWYYVRSIMTGESGWTNRASLEFPAEPAPVPPVDGKVIEDYVNAMGFRSGTETFVMADTPRRSVYVLKGAQGEWRLARVLPCSAGAADSPTVKGLFTITTRGEWFYSKRLGSGARHWARFCGQYLFHSQAMDENRRILERDNDIGRRNSNGCVRFYPADAEWFYKNVPDGTAVFVR